MTTSLSNNGPEHNIPVVQDGSANPILILRNNHSWSTVSARKNSNVKEGRVQQDAHQHHGRTLDQSTRPKKSPFCVKNPTGGHGSSRWWGNCSDVKQGDCLCPNA